MLRISIPLYSDHVSSGSVLSLSRSLFVMDVLKLSSRLTAPMDTSASVQLLNIAPRNVANDIRVIKEAPTKPLPPRSWITRVTTTVAMTDTMNSSMVFNQP
jgi:hypothetical protein